ncbi:MAG: CCA tRNA nucleotidyltransferase [Candidatus Pacebacteria bacterium]|nr:CCA tRNA nucleotidyltransferase [Candidatus Paceibacterota bacterium]
MNKELQKKIPEHVVWVLGRLQNAGFESFIVGGCVRDLFIERTPNDWDITTNAIPEQIMEVFEETDMRVVYENSFGTVGIVNKELEKDDVSYEIEVTPYRTETTYSDGRHPDSVTFSDSINEDVKRRDFTINAMAYDPISNILVDNYEGQKDLKTKIIKTVGDAEERFGEDALRIMRAVRFSAQLGFICENETILALKKGALNLEKISAERIRDEFIKIVDADYAKDGLEMLRSYGLLEYIIPELLEGVDMEQGGAHDFDVWTHLVKSLEHGTNKQYPFHVKLAALFHDIGKPRSRRAANGRGSKEWTFYGHEVIGANMSEKILKRLKFPNDIREKVVKLVRYHMFFSDPDEISLSAVRRMVKNVGKDMIWELMDLRTCDRIGTGRPKEKPYRLRKYHAMIEEVLRDPISVGMLKLNGDIMIAEMNLKPGRKMGWVLHALLEEVLDDPKKNTREYLEKRAREMYELSDNEIQKLGEAGKDKRDYEEFNAVKKLHRKHKVE